MKTRIARKIVKTQEIRCRSRFGGPENIRTAGRISFPEAKYQKALRLLLRRMDRETAKPSDGSVMRCAGIQKEMTAARLKMLIERDSAAKPSSPDSGSELSTCKLRMKK
jgi:hypothetical protein